MENAITVEGICGCACVNTQDSDTPVQVPVALKLVPVPPHYCTHPKNEDRRDGLAAVPGSIAKSVIRTVRQMAPARRLRTFSAGCALLFLGERESSTIIWHRFIGPLSDH